MAESTSLGMKEKQLEVNKALAGYSREQAEELFFDVLADPENTAVNEERYRKIEKALKTLEQVSEER